MIDPSPDYHTPVLLKEAMDGLEIREDGIYVDCTFGGGGHSAQILSHLNQNGRLFGFDQDADARKNEPADKRFTFIPQNFRHLQRFLRLHGVRTVNGILADLGVSSHQFNEASRGFSTRFEGDLDMRMDNRQTLTAATVLNTYSEQALHKMLEQYGEVTNSKTLAKAVVQLRGPTLFNTVRDFRQRIAHLVKGNPNRYFAQVFQALRMEVNDEITALKEMLQQAPAMLGTGGRLVVITFHSIEDRIVKNFFRDGTFEATADLDPFGTGSSAKPLRIITKKPITPTETELKQNTRSRSAKLRIAEKI
jgi:16S rRNA (cytosine1402-N4)-methyltransferase